jgi:hypothetical protein
MYDPIGIQSNDLNSRLQIDLAASLKDWYVDMLEIDDVCATVRTKTQFSRFYITNYAKYKHCFDCNVYWCMFCGPCWLLSAPIYKVSDMVIQAHIGSAKCCPPCY